MVYCEIEINYKGYRWYFSKAKWWSKGLTKTSESNKQISGGIDNPLPLMSITYGSFFNDGDGFIIDNIASESINSDKIVWPQGRKWYKEKGWMKKKLRLML